MRIVIDLQGAQAWNKFRGIGRYSLAFAKAVARQASVHDIWFALNGLFPDTIEPLRASLNELVPQNRIVVWQAPGPVAEINPENRWRREASERIREAFFPTFNPDMLHVSSLFEGLSDDAVTTIGSLESMLPTAVTLYDLIPLIHRDLYLADPIMESWYERKLGSLRRAQLWLAISESSRREGIDYLNLPEEWVVNVSTAADPMFQRVSLSIEKVQSIRQYYGLTRPFVMYTGGIDHRKNIEGLIRAYSKLPAELRSNYHLAIVCSATEAEINSLKRFAERVGLVGDELVFTGFISNEDLVALYNLCSVFAFPSWHEGFGLPALEAMACGAAVIGANTSSLPEVIGRADALFDPYDENDIAAKLYMVLKKDGFREQLKHHGLEQAKKFSWDITARRALEAFERLYARKQSAESLRVNMPVSLRPRLAYVSPLPPEQSGIAAYSAELLPELALYYDIDVIVSQPEVVDPWIRANCPIRGADWFDQEANRYDRVIYHLGNSAFHQHMFGLLERHPGTVVLHDFFLSGVMAHMEWFGLAPGAWTVALYASHGYHAIKERFATPDRAEVIWEFPANLAILQQANGVIVHSEFSRALATQWYGDAFGTDWKCISHLRKPVGVTDRVKARTSFGLKDKDFLVCAFGMVGPNKLNHRLLSAWLASPLAQDPHCHLVFVGENHAGEYGSELLRIIAQSEAAHRIKITGFAPPALYHAYLTAADLAVQLRTLSRGETSGTVLDCMNYGLATIVNAHGAMAEVPDGCILRLSDKFSDAEFQAALLQLWRDPAFRRMLGDRARAELRTHHNPRRIASQYRDAIEHFAKMGPQAHKARLVHAIAELEGPPGNEREWVAVAQAVAVNHQSPKGLKQILVDVSELVQWDAKSGIQRVVRSILSELLKRPPEGCRIEPVYASDGFYRYARCFTLKLLGCPDVGLLDEPMEATRGDIFLGLDLAMHAVLRYPGVYAKLREQGVGVFFVVYDLLCVRRPDCFVESAFDDFSRWLRIVSDLSDGAICISRTVSDDLEDWLDVAPPSRQRPFKVGWFHLGADINFSLARDGVVPGFDRTLEQLREFPSVLMVGTIEPRKGYAQSLAAFELMWDQGVEVTLIIVGKQGWKVEALVNRLRQHPQAGNRLFWFENATDEMLLRLYETAEGLLMASEGEGFGLPLIEAAQYRLPVLARDIPVFREVGSEHVSYFSGSSDKVLAEALQVWLAMLAEGRAPKPENIKWLTWSQSAETLVEMILKNTHPNWTRIDKAISKGGLPLGVSDLQAGISGEEGTEPYSHSSEDSKMDKTVNLKLPDGHLYKVTGAFHDRSVIGTIESQSGLYEPHVMKVIQRIVKSDFICMDIGANIGAITLAIAKEASNGRCFSIECSSKNYSYLVRNITQNKVENAIPIHCGVSDLSQVVSFNYVKDVAGCSFVSPLGIQEGESEEIQLRRIDDIISCWDIPKVDFMKLDVEGGERKALLGSQALFGRSAPILLIEFNPTPIKRFYGEDPEELFQLLQKTYSYIYLIQFPSGHLKLIKSIDELMMMISKGKGWEDLLCANFDISNSQ